MRKSVGLIMFLKGSSNPKQQMPGCANYDHYYGGCSLWGECRQEQGKRCDYFEEGRPANSRRYRAIGSRL
jgi:hypothetical protein